MPNEPSPPSKGKTLAIVLGVVALAAVVSCLATALLLKKVAQDFQDKLGPEEWRDDAIAIADLPRVYGVSLPAPPPLMRSRRGGFQDPIYEVLFRLPPGGEAAFLSGNRLRRDAGGELSMGLDEAKAELRAHQPTATVITVTPLAGLEDLRGGDGGYVELFRSGALLEADGQTWVYLIAFGT